MLKAMKPGYDYMARDLAVLLDGSSMEMTGLLNRAVAEGRVEVIGTAPSGPASRMRYNVYRIKE